MIGIMRDLFYSAEGILSGYDYSMEKIVVIVGPTASGKSDLGVMLAKKIQGEIISADSRQVYKGLNIGSGKITKKEMRGVSHYGLDIANPKKIFTAEDFKKHATQSLNKIICRGKIPIIVGGTGFYIDVLLGLRNTANVPPNPQLRKRIENKSANELFMMLKKLDPERAKTIDQHNPRRLVRAIEIAKIKEQPAYPLAFLARLSEARSGFRASLSLAKLVNHTRFALKTRCEDTLVAPCFGSGSNCRQRS